MKIWRYRDRETGNGHGGRMKPPFHPDGRLPFIHNRGVPTSNAAADLRLKENDEQHKKHG